LGRNGQRPVCRYAAAKKSDRWGRKKGTGFGLREKINNKTRKSPCIPLYKRGKIKGQGKKIPPQSRGGI